MPLRTEAEIDEAIRLYTAALSGAGGPVPSHLRDAWCGVLAGLYWLKGVEHIPNGGPPVPVEADLEDIRRALKEPVQAQPSPPHMRIVPRMPWGHN